MTLSEFLQKRKEQIAFIAIYEELIYVLDKALNKKLEIPVNSEDVVVPDASIAEVRGLLVSLQKEHQEQIQKLDQTELK